MAILKQKLNRKNDSGTYDTIHLETNATIVKMSESDSTTLSNKISNMDTAIAGKQPAGSYAAANHNHNGIYQPVGNYAAANHNHNGTYATVAQYNELKTSVSNGKSAVASAITDKGVSTSATASFDTMASNIRSIETASGSLINLPNGYLYSTTTFVHGFSMSWFNESSGNSTLDYPINSNYAFIAFGAGGREYTNFIDWTSGRGSNSRADSYYEMYEKRYGNIFTGINLKGYTKVNIKMTDNQVGNVYMFIVQILPSGVLQLYRYTINASSSTNYSGTTSLGFTGNSRPYTIICGAFNGYYHTVQFT